VVATEAECLPGTRFFTSVTELIMCAGSNPARLSPICGVSLRRKTASLPAGSFVEYCPNAAPIYELGIEMPIRLYSC